MDQWDHRIDTWLAQRPDLDQNPLPGMRQADLLAPVADYATLARVKGILVERTGRLGLGGVWSGHQLVFRHFIRTFGSEAQRNAWAGRTVAVAISEPKVGAHPKLLTTCAEPEAGGFRITGQKAWVSNGPSADCIIVFAITAQQQGRKLYSAFLVPHDTSGLSITEMPGFHALRPSRHCLLALDGCLVPAAAVLGEANTAYERMALPFRDIEDAIGGFGILGAFRFALGLFVGATASKSEQAGALGAIAALTALFQAGAAAVVASLDDGRLRDGDPALIGLRILALDVTARLRACSDISGLARKDRLDAVIADLDTTLSVARGPRLARQARLGNAVIQPAISPA